MKIHKNKIFQLFVWSKIILRTASFISWIKNFTNQVLMEILLLKLLIFISSRFLKNVFNFKLCCHQLVDENFVVCHYVGYFREYFLFDFECFYFKLVAVVMEGKVAYFQRIYSRLKYFWCKLFLNTQNIPLMRNYQK